MKNPLAWFGSSKPDAGNPELENEPRRLLRTVRDYHRASSHQLFNYASGPQDLDWETQPDPFRRYAGTRHIDLEHVPLSESARFDDAFGARRITIRPVDRRSISQLFEDSLALSAWKQYGTSRWALRVNPSSGNLHPTEGYLICGAIEGLCERPMVAHYAPREHALEVRSDFSESAWALLSATFANSMFFVGTTSIVWREAWKYGERAWRYCELDVGHAIGAFTIAAAGLGWNIALIESPAHDDLAWLLGVRGQSGPEAEEPGCLLAVIPSATSHDLAKASIRVPVELEIAAWHGRPNELSPDHVEWRANEVIALATRKPRTDGVYAQESIAPLSEFQEIDAASSALVRPIVHARRSAVAFDGRTSMTRTAFYRVLASTLRAPIRVLPWSARIHLALFVQRVEGLAAGLYVLVRDREQKPLLQAAFEKAFAWERAADCPRELDLYLLAKGDPRSVARQVSCHQEIASDGCFSLGMFAEFDPSLERYGAWFYPRLYWECGFVGQMLYLAAEEAGLRATGIGCFFDEPVHATFGLSSWRYRSLYHLALGAPVEDRRLTTWPAYPSRGDEGA